MAIRLLLIALLYIMGTASIAVAQSCQNLFETPLVEATQVEKPAPVMFDKPISIESLSRRVEINQISNDNVISKLKIVDFGFSKNLDIASIELMRLVTANSSFILEEKNVLTKDKLVLGIPIKDGYSFEVQYVSDSRTHSRFVIDRIDLVSPTGKDFKIADSVVELGSFKVKNASYELKNLEYQNLDITLKIPLLIEGKVLERFANYASYFEFYTKDEMRTLLKSNSITKITTSFRLRKAKDVFYKVLIKEPFKLIVGGSLLFLVINGSSFIGKTDESKTTKLIEPPAITQTLNQSINNNIGSLSSIANPTIQKQLAEVQALAEYSLNQKTPHIAPKLHEIKLDSSNLFSQIYNIWVFEKVGNNNLKETYLIFSEEKTMQNKPVMQYLALRIDNVKYRELVQYIKQQGQIQSEITPTKNSEKKGEK